MIGAFSGLRVRFGWRKSSGVYAVAVALLMPIYGCADQTTAQQRVGIQAAAAGLLCVADIAGQIVVVTDADGTDGRKAIEAAQAAGHTITTNAACAAALAGAANRAP